MDDSTALIDIKTILLDKINDAIKEKNISEIKNLAVSAPPPDVAEIIASLPPLDIIFVLKTLHTNVSAEIFSFFDIVTNEKIIMALTSDEIFNLLDILKDNVVYDLLEELPSNLVKKIIAAVPPKSRQRDSINQLLNYDEDMAGGLINTDFIELKEDEEIDLAIARIRRNYNRYDHISTYYVVNKERTLVSSVSIQKLVFSKSNLLIKDVADGNIIYCYDHDDQETVANIFKKYDVNELPVLNKDKKLLGIITVDDVIDVIEEEATEDIQKLAAVEPLEFSYLRSSIFKLTRSRIRWLAVLMISATLSQIAITAFNQAIPGLKLISNAALLYLFSLLPIISGTSGNAGSQSSTIIIRSLSIGEITVSDYVKVLWKEFKVAAFTGLLLAIINALRMIVINLITNYTGSSAPHVFMTGDQLKIMLSTMVALFIVIVLANLVGISLPMLAQVLKIDPAVMAAPLLTTLLDALSTTIFFSAAILIYVVWV